MSHDENMPPPGGVVIENSQLFGNEIERLSDDEKWKIVLIANRYRVRDEWKPNEVLAFEYIQKHQVALKMQFGKYKDLGWTVREVIERDGKYSEWLCGQIREKGDKMSPFEKWFLDESDCK